MHGMQENRAATVRERSRSCALAAACLVLLCGAAGAAQRGTLTILVTDANKRPLENARVKAMKIGGKEPVEANTGGEGTVALDLPVGDYGITVRAEGFGPDFTGGVRCRADSNFELHFLLHPGDVNRKLPHEKTPEERAAELEKLKEKLGYSPPPSEEAVKAAYAGLDEACKTLGIERTGGGPADRRALVEIGMNLVRERKMREALEKFRQAIGEDASDPLSWFNLGVLYQAQKQSTKAELCFRTAIGLCGGGGEPDYHAYLGRVLGAQGKLKEAERSFRTAIAMGPDREGLYLYELGTMFHGLRDFKRGIELFREAIEKNCPDPAVYFGLGNALEMSGQNAAAIQAYQDFLAKAKGDAELEQLYVPKVKEKLARLGQGVE